MVYSLSWVMQVLIINRRAGGAFGSGSFDLRAVLCSDAFALGPTLRDAGSAVLLVVVFRV